MATIKNFEDLEIWKMSRELVKLIYSDVKLCRDYAFKDQISKAGISVMNNIAEGFCRASDKEFRNFLNFSKGSIGEVKSMYYVAEDLNYVSSETAFNRRNQAQRLCNSIGIFMKYLKPNK
jgi:four helix bundle protein